MQELSTNTEQTMSSLEIAELTGKEHFHVMRDVETVLQQAEIDATRYGGTYLDKSNRQSKCFNLPKRECDLVVSGYSVPYRLAIIDRWMELEATQRVPTQLELARQLVTLLEDLEDTKAKVKTLEIEVDDSHQYATIKRMERATGDKFDWRELKAAGITLDIPRKDVFDQNYGTVKSYHADTWMEAYGLDLPSVLS